MSTHESSAQGAELPAWMRPVKLVRGREIPSVPDPLTSGINRNDMQWYNEAQLRAVVSMLEETISDLQDEIDELNAELDEREAA